MDCIILRVTSLLLWVVFAFTDAASSPGKLVCPVNAQKLLTADRTLLNPESIYSSSEDTGSNPANHFIDPRRSWCSAEDTYNISEQYVGIVFTEPIVATLIVSGGLSTSYVMNFSIHHTISPTEEDFQPYGILKPVQEFIVPTILASDVYFSLETPLLAKRLKFHINDGLSDPFSRICWSIIIYGCKESEAYRIEDDMETVTTPSTTPTILTGDTTTESTSKSSEQSPPISCTQPGILQKDLLLIVIPSAVVLIILFLIIVTVGVLICLCCVKSPQPDDSPTYESVKMKIGNKRTKDIVELGDTTPGTIGLLYDQPRPQFYDVPKSAMPTPHHESNLGSTSTLGSHMEIKNPVYLAKKNLQDISYALHQMPSDNDYEDVLDTPSFLAGMERQTQTNAAYAEGFRRPPMRTPDNDNTRPPLRTVSGRTLSLDNTMPPKYSRVSKERREGGDGVERGRSTSPVIKSHYMSTNAAITQELNRLTTELENSLKGNPNLQTQ